MMSKYRIEITEGNAEPAIISKTSIEINDESLIENWNEAILDVDINADLLESRKTRDYLIDIVMVETEKIRSLFVEDPYNPLVVILSDIYGVTEDNLCQQIHEGKIIDAIHECQFFFKEVMEACLNENPIDKRFQKIKTLSVKDRYYYCKKNGYGFIADLENTTIKCSMYVDKDFNPKQGKTCMTYVYYPENLFEVCHILFTNMVINDLTVRKCKNCNKYFVKNKNYNNEYCSRLIPGKNKTTCKDVGAMRLYRKNYDEIQNVYDKAYKRHYAQACRKNITFAVFDEWVLRAKSLKEEAREKNITDKDILDTMFKKISLKIPRKKRYSDY